MAAVECVIGYSWEVGFGIRRLGTWLGFIRSILCQGGDARWCAD